MKGIDCVESHGCGNLPGWLDKYIKIMGTAPNRFDFAESSPVMVRGAHYRNNWSKEGCNCMTIPSQKILDFWDALASVIHGNFGKVSVVGVLSCFRMLNLFQTEKALSLVREQEKLNTPTFVLVPFSSRRPWNDKEFYSDTATPFPGGARDSKS